MQRQQQARDIKIEFCPNENILPSSSLTTEQEQKQDQDQGRHEGGEKTPPEAFFGGGGRRGPGPAIPDAGQDGGDPLPKNDDDDDPTAAALFSPTANPNLCRDPNHPIPVCHKIVFRDLDDAPYELPRCYPC